MAGKVSSSSSQWGVSRWSQTVSRWPDKFPDGLESSHWFTKTFQIYKNFPVSIAYPKGPFKKSELGAWQLKYQILIYSVLSCNMYICCTFMHFLAQWQENLASMHCLNWQVFAHTLSDSAICMLVQNRLTKVLVTIRTEYTIVERCDEHFLMSYIVCETGKCTNVKQEIS